MSETNPYKIGDQVIVTHQDDETEDPPVGTFGIVTHVDDSNVPVQIACPQGNRWLRVGQVKPAAPATTRIPTILEVVCECLQIIEELPPDERDAACRAIGSFVDNGHMNRALKCSPRGEP